MEFRLLGPVEAWHGGAAVSLGRRRERCLLGILLLEPGLVVRADLIDAHRFRAPAIATELGLPREQARAHDGIGAVTRTSDPRATREHWEKAMAIYDELNLPEAGQLRDQLSTIDTADAVEA